LSVDVELCVLSHDVLLQVAALSLTTYLIDFVIAPSSQEMESPVKPGRFTSSTLFLPASFAL